MADCARRDGCCSLRRLGLPRFAKHLDMRPRAVVGCDKKGSPMKRTMIMMLPLLWCFGCAGVSGGVQTGGQMPYAQDCAVRLRPPSPDKIPVMHGVVSEDGKTVMMTVSDVPADGIMQRDTRHCEAAAIGGTRKTEPRNGFDIVKLTRTTGSATPAVTLTVAEYKLESLPRQQWPALADRWPEATR